MISDDVYWFSRWNKSLRVTDKQYFCPLVSGTGSNQNNGDNINLLAREVTPLSARHRMTVAALPDHGSPLESLCSDVN